MADAVTISGWFVSSVFSKLRDGALSYYEGHKSWQSGMKADLDHLVRFEPQIENIIYMAERAHLPRDPNLPLYKWLAKLQDAVEDADNVLDELEYHRLKDEKMIVKFVKRAAQQDDLLKRLREILKNFNDLVTGLDTFAQVLRWFDQRFGTKVRGDVSQETGFLFTGNNFFGREEEKKTIIDWLTSTDTKEISVFSIVGVGGVGKTVLAQHIFEKLDCFETKIWVCVSRTFDEKTIAKKIVKSLLTDKELKIETISEAQRTLIEALSAKKFFLVLDNVWNDKEKGKWEKLIAPLRYGGEGSKVLLTTRMESVADMVAKLVGESKMSLKLNGLGERESMLLFEKSAFVGYDPKDYPKLQSIGNEIVTKLSGIPLAVKSIGGMLNDKLDDEFWTSVLKDGALNSDKEMDGIMEAIRLSYEHLPPELKPCFRFCSLFPQDHKFNREQLVDMWVSIGLIPEGEERKEKVASNFFEILVGKSFFEPKESYYTMHDLLHEVAQFVSKNECLCVTSDSPIQIVQNIRHLSLRTSSISVLKNLSGLKYLRTLLLYCHIKDPELGDVICTALKGFKTLRYLGLSSKHLRDFPESIGNLVHLRSLNINRTQIPKLSPCVCMLYHLQILEFTSSPYFDHSKGSIPSNIYKLSKLKKLYLPSNAISMVQHIGKLTALQQLIGYSVGDEVGYDISELEMMLELRELLITNLENVKNSEEASKAKLTSKQHLRHIALMWGHGFGNTGDKNESHKEVADCLQPHPRVIDLLLHGYQSTNPPYWLEAQILLNLTHINLAYCSLERLPPLGQLPCLKCLYLENMVALKKIGLEFYRSSRSEDPFPALETLKLLHLMQLEEWTENTQSEKWFPCLKKLIVLDCPNLKKLPSIPTSLEELELNSLEIIELPDFKYQNEGSSTNQGPRCLSSLVIFGCSKLVSLSSGFFNHLEQLASLEELTIWNCNELVRLPSEGFRELVNLKSLRIQECKFFFLPMLVPKNFFPPSIQRVMLSSCEDLVASLPQLLCDISFITLLKLEDCSNLISLPSENVLRCLTSLREVKLRNCKRVKSLGGLGAISSLKILMIKTCPMLTIGSPLDPTEESPRNRLSMTLDKLDIDRAEYLFVVPLRNLYFTKSVEIRGFSSMTTFPDQWLQQNAASLRTLGLYGLNSVDSFPDSLQTLTSLKMLVLHNAFRLARLPELPESLEILDIDGCNEELAGRLKDGGLDFDKVRDLDVGVFGVRTRY
ncbi:NBS-LRR-like resistance protein [Rhynchospora pubera]|uniref:NBS-LRR-like resistance protein n=1 Tax=Rhynchospora pubera TaxID=906938 RepID=A0AAV8D3N2_9POAL|nr:NBS-LRR-like resistance protein [Rhynchospora pubera]